MNTARKRFLISWLVALGTLLSVEVGLRVARGSITLPYQPGVRAYRAFDAELKTFGAAPISIVGSSRGREGLLVPTLNEVWKRKGGPEGVANYSLAGSQAQDVEVVVRRLLESKRPPKLIIYALSARQIAARKRQMIGKQQFLWHVGDWWRTRSDLGAQADEHLPAAIKNQLASYSLLFSFRGELVEALKEKKAGSMGSALKRLWTPTDVKANPMRGTTPPWQQGKSAKATYKVPKARIKKYLADRYKHADWPNTFELPHIATIARLCKEAGVKLVFVEVPTNPLLDAQLPKDTSEKFRQGVRKLARRAGVRFVEVKQLKLDVTLDWRRFREQSHLNIRGAVPFSRAVAQALLSEVNAALPASTSER